MKNINMNVEEIKDILSDGKELRIVFNQDDQQIIDSTDTYLNEVDYGLLIGLLLNDDDIRNKVKNALNEAETELAIQ